ncbi:hypothetical protein PG991_000496 [Apiospora marii]|uniref:Uncharacterized protein n=1 Tax=Apiospora marii TaxID=335849 RepID=A0ABR1T2A9_9PEZI
MNCKPGLIQREIDPSQLAEELKLSDGGDLGLQARKHAREEDRDERSWQLGKVLIVEDISKELIEELGSKLDIDPMFFAAHVHSDWRGAEAPTPKYCELPSQTWQQQDNQRQQRQFATFHYHRSLVFPEIENQDFKLLRRANISRKVVVFPSNQDHRLGLSQHCCSTMVLRPTQENARCLGIILTDPPMSETYISLRGTQQVAINTLSRPLFGGAIPMEPTERDVPTRGAMRSMLQELLCYWSNNPPLHGATNSSALGELSYHPLRIICSEWVNYKALMCFSLREYDTLLSGGYDADLQLEKINSALMAISSWPRRVASSTDSLNRGLSFIEHHADQAGASADNAWVLLHKDYEYLIQSISQQGDQLQAAIPLVSTFLQLVEGRRNYAETRIMSRLSILALVFVPLSFVSSLFSMNETFSPGGPMFWVYFATAIPVLTSVLLFAARPLSPGR